MNSSSSNKISFSYSFIVQKEHLDQLNHVNNIVYLQWVQEASEKHWNTLASKSIKETNIWMALRHEIDYINQSFLNDEITIVTWIDESKGVKSVRIVEVYTKNKLLCKCKTTWVLLDSNSKKPKRITDRILAIFHPNR